MSDISQSSQAAITQALTQLSKLAPSSELTKQGAEVLVKHLAGNVLSLNKNAGLINKTVLLNTPEIKGRLVEGQTHQVKLSLEHQPSLEFFSSTSAKTTSVISLTEQQIQSLFRLPAKQLIPGNLLAKSDVASKLPTLNAVVLPSLADNPTNSKTAVIANSTQTATPNNQTNTLRLSLIDQRPPIEIALPNKQLNQFTAGEKVTLAIVPRGNNWQVTVLQTNTGTPVQQQNTNKDNVQLNGQLSRQQSGQLSTQLKPQLNNPQALSKSLQTTINITEQPTTVSRDVKIAPRLQSILPPLLAVPLIKASLSEQSKAKPVDIELPLKPVIQQLLKTNVPQNLQLLEKLQSLPIDKIFLQVKPSGEAQLLLQNIKSVASIPITKDIAKAITSLRLPEQQALIKLLNSPTDGNKHTQTNVQTASQEKPLTTTRNSFIEVDKPTQTNVQTANQSLKGSIQQANTNTISQEKPILSNSDSIKNSGLSIKEATAQLITALQKNTSVRSIVTPELLNNRPEQVNLVQSLLRIVQARAEAPAATLLSLEKGLTDHALFKEAAEQPDKKLIEQVLQQIKQTLPQGKEADANGIRQLLTTPALNLSALQMVSPSSNQGLIGGLVTLLQMSLSARLMRNQPNRSDIITTALNSTLSGSGKVKPTITPKTLNDLSQIEQKHQLMKDINRLLSGHQASKLNSAEQMIQGQESFYYNLPSVMGGSIKDIELLIKREEEGKDQSTDETQNTKTWKLTMKLAVGELGELLTKVKLRPDNIEIDFYASNETVQIQVMNFLPLLRRKLDSFGIEITKSQCQLGKIPDTLQQKPYHVFQTKA